MNENRKVYIKLIPSEWSKSESMSPLERAKCFFLFEVNDLRIVKKAHREGLDYIIGRSNLATCRSRFSKLINTNAFSDNFDITMSFYYGLICSATSYSTSMDKDISERWPNLKFTASSSCCSALNDIIVSKKSAFVRNYYPPWHFSECSLFAEDSDGALTSVNGLELPERFCNPIDLLEAYNLNKIKHIKSGELVYNPQLKREKKPDMARSIMLTISIFGLIAIVTLIIFASCNSR